MERILNSKTLQLVREGDVYELADSGIQSSASNHGIIEHFIRYKRFLSNSSGFSHFTTHWGDGGGRGLGCSQPSLSEASLSFIAFAVIVFEMEKKSHQTSKQQQQKSLCYFL